MKKNLITTLALGLMVLISTNTAFSAPCKDCGCPPPQFMNQNCTCPDCAKRAEFEKRRMEFEKLSPAEKEKKIKEIQKQRIEEFEQKLNLTEEQKAKAKEIRLKGHEQMKPIIDQIRVKKQEIRKIKMSKLSTQEQEKRIKTIKAQIKPLKIKADKLRKQNMAEFESILTVEQKTTLEKMKKEAPKKPNHHHRPPCPECAPACPMVR